eukprot:jgi/Botrbrau1/6070/Bobra.177_1s0010.1
MSKKNNLKIRARQHEFDLRREKEALQKKNVKADKKRGKQQLTGVKKRKVKNKPIRLRKGKFVKGIKIVDSDSKKKAKAALRAEKELNMKMGKMEVESDAEWEEATEEEIVAMNTG